LKKKILFIINPTSGLNKQKGIENLIRKSCNSESCDFDIRYTEYAGHGSILGKQAVETNCSLVMVVGGDGTVNEVSQHLVGTQTALGIIPAGSGNGLSMHLNIPQSFEKALSLIEHGKIVPIDTASIDGKSSFIGVSGIGFDAHISKEFSRFGKRGFLSYIRLTLREYSSYQPKDYELFIDGNLVKRKAFLICFANSSQYGNRAYIAPGANIEDGILNICILKKIPILKVPFFIMRLFNKNAKISPLMEMIMAKEIIVRNTDQGILYHVDGEPRNTKEDLRISVNPASLKVLVPTS
jgi:diacylglycerol kinase (ATP)